MTEIINLAQNENRRDLVHHLVFQLVEGKIIAFPTETVYSVCAYSIHQEAIQKLLSFPAKNNTQTKNGTSQCLLVLKGLTEFQDFFPERTDLEQKLLRRSWPGPLIARILANENEGLFHSFSSTLKDSLRTQNSVNSIRVRCPAHSLIHEIMQLLPAPLVFLDEMSQNDSHPITTMEHVQEKYPELLDVIVDDGPTRYSDFSSEIDISNNHWELIHSSIIDEQVLSEMTNRFFLFVCTGNTCRSPLAEGLFRKILAEKVGCKEAELHEQGYIVASAGIAATYGAPASLESIEVAETENVDINSHQSQPLSQNLVDEADYIFTMTRQHRDFIISAKPDAADRVKLLSQDGMDILDPIGGDYSIYEACKKEIEQNLRLIADQIDT